MRTLLLLFSSIIALHTIQSQEALARVTAHVNENTVKGHLSYIASDELKGRDTGSDGLKAAGAYIKSHFISLGIDTMAGINGYFQPVPFRTTSMPSSAELDIDGHPMEFLKDFIVVNGKETQSTSMIVNVGHGSQKDIDDADLRLKYAISIAGDGEEEDPRKWIGISAEKRKRVRDAGGIGLVEIYQSTAIPWRYLRRIGGQKNAVNIDEGQAIDDMSNIWIGTEDSLAMVNLKTDDKIVRMKFGAVERSTFESANVVGFIEGTDEELKDEYIVYSAHYDHIGIGRADAKGDTIYNGARDNGVGTTAVLSLASHFAKHPPRRSSIFVLFTAEEKGLLGSKYFTQNLPVPADKIKYNYNIDNGGYNDTTIISVVGLTRTEAEQDILDACQQLGLTAIEDAAGEQGLFDRSDNVNFAKLGIPAPTFSLGFTAFDAEIMKYYHQAGDEVENLDLNYVTKYVKSYILSAEKIANRDQAPFWKEGDKYYDQGVKLYKGE